MRRSKFLTLSLLVLGITLLIQSCSTSKSAVNSKYPHIYHNDFEEVKEATQEAIKNADMKIIEAKNIDDKNYSIRYFSKSYDIAGSNNREAGLEAIVTITEIDENRTQITIEEEEQSHMVPGSHKETLGRDVLRQLRKLVTHGNDIETN